MSQSIGRILKIFLVALPPDSLILLSLLLIRPCYAAGFGNIVLSFPAELIYFKFTLHMVAISTFLSIISFTDALAGGGGGSSGKIPKGPDCLRYATEVDVDMLKTWEL